MKPVHAWLLSVAAFFPVESFAVSGGSSLQKVCEDMVKERLRSPSSYSLIEAHDVKVDHVSPTENYGLRMESIANLSGEARDKLKAIFDQEYDLAAREGMAFKRISIDIEFDAMNGFGVPIRHIASCRYIRREDAGEPINLRPEISIHIR